MYVLYYIPVSSLYEEWLRRHRPNPSQYPTSNAPIGHNGEYHMVPFLPLHTNREYFITSKELGYEYSRLLATSKCSKFKFPFVVASEHNEIAHLRIVCVCLRKCVQ